MNDTASAKDWFNLIFDDDHYRQTQAQFNALDEGTKAQVRAIFEFDVFKNKSEAQSWEAEQDKDEARQAKELLDALITIEVGEARPGKTGHIVELHSHKGILEN